MLGVKGLNKIFGLLFSTQLNSTQHNTKRPYPANQCFPFFRFIKNSVQSIYLANKGLKLDL